MAWPSEAHSNLASLNLLSGIELKCVRQKMKKRVHRGKEGERERETVGLEVDRDTWAWIRRSVVRDDRAVRLGGGGDCVGGRNGERNGGRGKLLLIGVG